MSALRLAGYDDPVLRRRADEVGEVTDDIRAFLRAMFSAMAQEGGVGLAAPQVRRSQRIIVVDATSVEPQTHPMALVNPVILKRWGGTSVATEGCLSLPGIEGDVRRARRIRVQATRVAGRATEPTTFDAEGWEARIIQHEVDHLDGVLFIDRLRLPHRWLAERRLAKLSTRPSPSTNAQDSVLSKVEAPSAKRELITARRALRI
ncbi:MAG: peptide deformylase [Candidatus Omnitrophica bacterium]|nr:peptide deformylase [Candidatus Omnitrophota bacterium]